MKCHCGYEGIPTHSHDEKDPHWKCPACHARRPDPLPHDPAWEADAGKWICSQCGMWALKPEDLHTTCPGHGANWNLPVYHCTCGEWAFAPKSPQKTLICKRCKVEYPDYLRADYVPPPPTGKRVGLAPADAAFIAKLRQVVDEGVLDGLFEALKAKAGEGGTAAGKNAGKGKR